MPSRGRSCALPREWSAGSGREGHLVGTVTPAFALRKKPEAAFEALYRQHVHDIYRYSLAVLGNPADAEDVTQTTFLNAYRAIQSGERPRKPANWLRTIAHNVCRQRFRQAARRPRDVVAFDELEHPAAPEETEGPSPADITRALQALPFTQRSALVMREMEGRRQTEIAAELGVSESAVEALLFRARRAMREQIEASITCGEAARAISRQLDRSLPRAERGGLRAHLRECEECATFARRARAQRGALKSLGAIPLPASLASWFGGQGTVGVGAAAIGLKVAAGVAAVAVMAGAGDLGIRYLTSEDQGRGEAAQREAGRAEPHARPAVAVAPPIEPARGNKPSAPRTVQTHRSRRTRSPSQSGGRHRGHRSPSIAHGRAVRAHGAPAQSQGRAVRAHGAPAQSRGREVRAHGQPARPHELRPPHPSSPPAHGPSTDATPPKDSTKPPKP
jgi:RNA polymerase sigma factor (sigma-70 family)